MNGIDDIEELLHHGHFFVHKMYLSINGLQKKEEFFITPELPLFKIKKKESFVLSLFPTTCFDQIFPNLLPK